MLSCLVAILLAGVGCADDRTAAEVSAFTPDGEVQRTTNFTIVFSTDVAGDSLLGRPLDKAPVTFTPPIPGQFQWVASDKLRFYPDLMLAPSTEYAAEVLPEAFAGSPFTLKGERTFHFHTPRLQVNSAFLTFAFDPAAQAEAKLVATIDFNYAVDPGALRDYLGVLGAGGERLPFEITTAEPSTVITLEAAGVERGEQERRIRLQILEGVGAVGGNIGLANRYEKPVTLPGQNGLKVEQVTAVRESAASEYVRVAFNLPVRAGDAASFIRIEPEVAFRITGSHNQLLLRGDFSPEVRYQVTLQEGLTAVDGSALGRAFSTTVNFLAEDIPPQIDFAGRGFYLTRSGNLNVGLTTINVEKVTVEVEKVFANNLVYLLNGQDLASTDEYYYYGFDLNALGQRVHQAEIVVPAHPNQEVLTPIPLETYLRSGGQGVFRVVARQTDERWRSAARWVLATDLGLTAKKAGDDLWIWATSLSTLEPLGDVQLQLYSQNNQPLMTARTDAEGIAVFTGYTRFLDQFTPYVVTAVLGDDLSFIELTRRQISTADFDVGGAPYLHSGYEAFLFDERGVYRPGETAHVAAVVRGPNTAVPQPFPVRLRVTGPDQRVLTEQRATLNEQGAAAFDVAVPDYAMTGRYIAALLVGDDEEMGRKTFSVEEFVPDRMKVSVGTDREAYRPGEPIKIAVEGATLFGPPASGRRVQTTVEVEPYPFSPQRYQTFDFENAEKSFQPIKVDLEEQKLDAEGRLTQHYTLPADLAPPAALRAVIETTVLEPGGRGVTAYHGALVHPHATYVGLRQRQEGYAEPGKPTPFDFVVLDPQGNPVAGHVLKATLYYVYWNSILRQGDDGRYRYVSEKVEAVEQSLDVTSTAGIARLTVTPVEYGQYRLVLEDVQTGASTSQMFYSSGWGYTAWAMDTPDRVFLELDKDVYQAGETAKVLIRAPFAGKLLLTVEREQVLSHQIVTLEENTATVELPVKGSYKPNVYVAAHLIRATEDLERDASARAFGVVPLMVNSDDNRLEVALTVPSDMRPENKLQVDFEVRGASAVPYVAIAAVDEGILQLTDFETPDPHGYFFGKKRLEVASYDLYGLVLPEVLGTPSAPSGDVEAGRRRRLSPVTARRVKPVAFWSGLVKADGKGRGRVSFDVPQFNGTVRVMAVAFSGDRFGHADAAVLVRDPLVATPTFPRFIGSGDAFTVPVTVLNGSGHAGRFDVTLGASGPVAVVGPATVSIEVENRREGQAYFRVEAEETLGVATFTVSVRGEGLQTRQTTEVPLRPPVPFTTVAGSGSIQAGSEGRFVFPADFIPGTADFELTLSSFPAVKFSGSLKYLLQYPHGCIEQTTSRLFPLLAFNDLARAVEPALFQETSVDYFLEEGIAKLERLQLPSGSFAYWPGGADVNAWASVYASHFLVEARRAGYAVSERAYESMLDALGAIARSYRGDDADTYAQAAYAGYVLTIAGRPDRSTLLALKGYAVDRLEPYARYLLAGALALSGDQAAARELLPQTAAPPDPVGPRETGGNFDSDIRARAIMLDVLAQMDPGSPQVPALVAALSRSAEAGRWYTTQENAFAFLALGKILRSQAGGTYSGTLAVAGSEVGAFDETSHRFSSREWVGKEVVLRLQGSGTGYYYWRAEGLPASLHVDEYDHDLVVRRRYLDQRGSPIDAGTSFRQGDLVIAELTLRSPGETLENVAVTDLLPAGFEIENPRLQSRRGIDWIADTAYQPDYIDVRDDRMLIYGDLPGGRAEKFYYGLRVVSEGTFTLPPVRAEAMYAPMKASVSSSGRVTVLGVDEAGAGTK